MIANKEELMEALKLCATGCDDKGCIYLEEQNKRGGLATCRCVDLMAQDTLELLKSQQEKDTKILEMVQSIKARVDKTQELSAELAEEFGKGVDAEWNDSDWVCSKCGDIVRFMDKHCHNCGRKLKWD